MWRELKILNIYLISLASNPEKDEDETMWLRYKVGYKLMDIKPQQRV